MKKQIGVGLLAFVFVTVMLSAVPAQIRYTKAEAKAALDNAKAKADAAATAYDASYATYLELVKTKNYVWESYYEVGDQLTPADHAAVSYYLDCGDDDEYEADGYDTLAMLNKQNADAKYAQAYTKFQQGRFDDCVALCDQSVAFADASIEAGTSSSNSCASAAAWYGDAQDIMDNY